MTAPATPTTGGGWLAVFLWGIVAGSGLRIGWDVIGWVLGAVAARVG
jgi:hypothetical protein